MDEQTYKMYKDKIREAEDEITHILIDQNLVTSSILQKIEENIQRIKAFSMNIGGYLENECTKETLEKTQVAIAKKHLEILNKQSNDMDVGAEIRNKSFEMQKRNAEIQEELIQSQKESVVRQTERDKIAFETEQKMMTALESIAYSLAKLTVNSSNQNEDFKTVGAITEFIK